MGTVKCCKRVVVKAIRLAPGTSGAPAHLLLSPGATEIYVAEILSQVFWRDDV